jgi:hypothetical protein
MKFKDGVYTQVFSMRDGKPVRLAPTEQITVAMQEADRLHREMTGVEMVITAIFDGTHMEGSKHYEGNAFDVRRWHLGNRVKEFIARLKNELGPDYDVVEEVSHIHIEYDQKKN